MKAIVKQALDSAPAVAVDTFQGLHGIVCRGMEEALDVSFSESEATILTHAVLGIISTRAASQIGKDWGKATKSIRNSMEEDSDSESDVKSSSSLGPEHSRQHQVIVTADNFPLIELDSHSALFNVLTYLPYEDLNSLAVCNQRLRTLRSDPSLDQTRSITLDFRNDREGNSFNRLLESIQERNLRAFFGGNRRALRLRGYVENFDDATVVDDVNDELMLDCVSILDLRDETRPTNPYIEVYQAFSQFTMGIILPSITTVDVSGIDCNFITPRMMNRTFPHLETLIAYQCPEASIFHYGEVLRSWNCLNEIYAPGQERVDDNPLHFGLPPNIERLDIRFLKRRFVGDPMKGAELLDLLRHCKKLQWLRCDATADTLEQLREERPDVTIINI